MKMQPCIFLNSKKHFFLEGSFFNYIILGVKNMFKIHQCIFKLEYNLKVFSSPGLHNHQYMDFHVF
jgi:hypothetical protein